MIYKSREHKKALSYNETKNNIVEDKLEERKLASMRGTLTINFSKLKISKPNVHGGGGGGVRGGRGYVQEGRVDRGL